MQRAKIKKIIPAPKC